MKRRNDRRARLGFQWEAGSWDDASLWFDTLFRILQGHRVHWNLPAFSPDMPARRRVAVAKTLRTRIDASGDLVTSMGYAGACHPLLNLDELERELAWGLKNPWGSGITDSFDLRPPVLIPPVPDLQRPDAWKLYAAHGFALVGVCMARPLRAEPPDGVLPITRLRVAEAGRGDSAARLVRRLSAAQRELFLMLDLTGETSASHLEQVMDAAFPVLQSGHGLTLVEIPAHDGAPAAPAWSADWSPFPGPCVHDTVAAAAGLVRKKRKRSEEFQGILSLMAPRGVAAAGLPPAGPDSSNSRRLVAHMSGEVVLAGASFDVRLAGGRFCGLVSRGRDALPRIPAVSMLRTSTRELIYRTISSFSFEGEAGTGLREELGLDDREDSSISIEYSFREDSPLLSIRGEMRCPVLPDSVRVEQYAPLAIALRGLERGRSIDVEAWAPDGSASKATLATVDAPVVLPGARHRVRRQDGGWVVLCYSCPDGGTWGIPSFRIARQRGKLLLVVNPFGSDTPFPAAALSGRRESFSMLLGLEDA